MFFYCTVYNSNFLFSIRCSAATTRRNSFLVFFFFKWRKHRPNADGIDTLVQWKLIDSYSMLNYWVGFERTVMLSEFHLWNRLNDTRTCRPRGREEQTRDWKSIQQVVTSFQSRGRCDGLRYANSKATGIPLFSRLTSTTSSPSERPLWSWQLAIKGDAEASELLLPLLREKWTPPPVHHHHYRKGSFGPPIER